MERYVADILIDEYKNALIDKYYEYLDIIDDINLTLVQFMSENEIEYDDSKKFDYVSFCEMFISILKEDLHYYDTFSVDTMHHIYESLILKRATEKLHQNQEEQ